MVTADRRMRDSLRTARLTLRLPVPSDADELHAIFSDPRTNTIGDGPFTSPDQTAHWIASPPTASMSR